MTAELQLGEWRKWRMENGTDVMYLADVGVSCITGTLVLQTHEHHEMMKQSLLSHVNKYHKMSAGFWKGSIAANNPGMLVMWSTYAICMQCWGALHTFKHTTSSCSILYLEDWDWPKSDRASFSSWSFVASWKPKLAPSPGHWYLQTGKLKSLPLSNLLWWISWYVYKFIIIVLCWLGHVKTGHVKYPNYPKYPSGWFCHLQMHTFMLLSGTGVFRDNSKNVLKIISISIKSCRWADFAVYILEGRHCATMYTTTPIT